MNIPVSAEQFGEWARLTLKMATWHTLTDATIDKIMQEIIAKNTDPQGVDWVGVTREIIENAYSGVRLHL